MREFSKTKLSLAVASALVGGMAGTDAAQAVELDNTNRLGDAAVFQYYTAKGDWQTFFRLINTSDNAILVKLRFKEAANSREVLDFAVALSPHDAWSAWTDRNAAGDDLPGVRTQDTSCIFPQTNSGETASETFRLIDAATNLQAANFSSKGFTGVYDDGYAGNDTDEGKITRMSEGHLEVIGVAQYNPDGSSRERDFAAWVTHNDNGSPDECGKAEALLNAEGGGGYGEGEGADGADMENVLATNAYLVNVPSGQGAGYDPDMLKNCSDQPLEREYNLTATSPDLDSCDPGNWGYPRGLGPFYYSQGLTGVAYNQALWSGDQPPPPESEFYEVQWTRSPNPPTFDPSLTANVDQNGDGVCENTPSLKEVDIPANDVPKAVYDAAITDGKLAGAIPFANVDAPACDYAIVSSGGFADGAKLPTATRNVIVDGEVARLKQKGQWQGDPDYPVNQTPVTGGVDWVSHLFMHNSVINEWAAAPNPNGIITDYFTQWVLTFPTKAYYVDLQNDENLKDDISPRLVDLGGGNNAFAPFSQEFDGGDVPGTSCEPIEVQMWDRDERGRKFNSPEGDFPAELCWETNVLNFDQLYAPRGLNSSFATTVPHERLPIDANGDVSQKGWAELTFTGPGANWGLYNYGSGSWDIGLPVTGFMFSVYNTGDRATSHTAVNAHKYTSQVK
jgi:hypothetical protein